ncbi:MAG: M6 family metalloprotease domain-containing protein [Paludibacteraceae bacterium]|nr:M6 family metalloprotease domain-containing protein [Paludibacteraceae bacterium]
MKKLYLFILLSAATIAANAVPAKPGWQTRTQADGTTIEVQLVGDEYSHYYINKQGQEVRLNKLGMFEVVAEQPSPAAHQARRAKAYQARRANKVFGLSPNLAPRGIVILVNFADSVGKMAPAHTQEVFNELCNSSYCTVNTHKGIQYGSAAEYFADQSNGTYRPIFDVFGPVTLSKEFSYYGNNIVVNGEETDEYATDAVIEACILADLQIPELNFANYDSDNDGYVDFVYVIYAGKGEAAGGVPSTIWPHNWSIDAVIRSSDYPSIYSINQTKLDGVYLDTYAMSAELDNKDKLGGIGTLCHEFGHVMGLPDLYDTGYNTNHQNHLTPNEWDIMDMGPYNGDGHCPPNYDPWEKFFFGWVDPFNPGEQAMHFKLYPNGTPNYNVMQMNVPGTKKAPTEVGRSYYLENRQQTGWDTYLPAHGMIVWAVKYKADAWMSNTPNNTANNPLFTIICSDGTIIGSENPEGNVFGGSNPDATTWTSMDEKPVIGIQEIDSIIHAAFLADTTAFVVNWLVDGDTIETKSYGYEPLQLPAADFTPCDGTEFIGWTAEPTWCDPFKEPEDLFTDSIGKFCTGETTFRAVMK